MQVKELVKGKTYRYMAGAEAVPIIYMYATLNGYKFRDAGGIENILHGMSVERYIEEIKEEE